jgi:hypothetical protein
MRPQATMNGRKTGKHRQIKRLLRAANSNICQKIGLKPAAEPRPGSFNGSELDESIYSPANTLLAALLIIYPVVASVAVALAGMWFLASTGPA